MDKKTKISRVCGLLLTATPLVAFATPGYLDFYYSPTPELEFDDGSDRLEFEGDGYGLRGAAPVADAVLLTAEYQKLNYDEASVAGLGSGDVDIDDERWRLGIGLQAPEQAGFQWGLYGEYLDVTLEGGGESFDADGFAVHVRGTLYASAATSVYGQIGYVKLEDDEGGDADGPEYLVSGVFSLTPQLGVFVDYRLTDLEDDDGGTIKSDELRTGLRLHFGR